VFQVVWDGNLVAPGPVVGARRFGVQGGGEGLIGSRLIGHPTVFQPNRFLWIQTTVALVSIELLVSRPSILMPMAAAPAPRMMLPSTIHAGPSNQRLSTRLARPSESSPSGRNHSARSCGSRDLTMPTFAYPHPL
jgi:hypothetical protein